MSNQLLQEGNTLLRKKVRELEHALRDSIRRHALLHAEHVRLDILGAALVQKVDAYHRALDLLAAEVSAKNRSGREARESARKCLESWGIPPPPHLGGSRNRKRLTKRKKRLSSATA